MKNANWLVATTLLLGTALPVPAGDTLVQVSTLDALVKGIFEGDSSIGELKQAGDFGLGTLNGLDGEMVALDGKFLQITSDGKVHSLPDSAKTPFSEVTFFKPDIEVAVTEAKSLAELTTLLDAKLSSTNQFYAVRIHATFSNIKVRSVAKQTQPYVTLPEAVKSQALFDFQNITGTLVGFRCPVFVKGLNLPGYHFHFISDDLSGGGHVLDCALSSAQASFDRLENFKILVPTDPFFLKADFSVHDDAGLHAAESLAPQEKSAPAGK